MSLRTQKVKAVFPWTSDFGSKNLESILLRISFKPGPKYGVVWSILIMLDLKSSQIICQKMVVNSCQFFDLKSIQIRNHGGKSNPKDISSGIFDSWTGARTQTHHENLRWNVARGRGFGRFDLRIWSVAVDFSKRFLSTKMSTCFVYNKKLGSQNLHGMLCLLFFLNTDPWGSENLGGKSSNQAPYWRAGWRPIARSCNPWIERPGIWQRESNKLCVWNK